MVAISKKQRRFLLEIRALPSRRFRLPMPGSPFISGQKYKAVYRIQNLDDEESPVGWITIRIRWLATGGFVRHSFGIPPLKKYDEKLQKIPADVMSHGMALFFVENIDLEDKSKVVFFRNMKEPFEIEQSEGKASVFSIYARNEGEVYEFWGLMVAALSLFLIALKEVVIPFIAWLISQIN